MCSSMNSQQGLHTPSHSSLFHTCEDEKSRDPETVKVSQQRPDFCRTKSSINSSKVCGLIRSHSFPPEGWHQKKYALKVSKTAQKTRESSRNDTKETICTTSQTADLNSLPECSLKHGIVEAIERSSDLRETTLKGISSDVNIEPLSDTTSSLDLSMMDLSRTHPSPHLQGLPYHSWRNSIVLPSGKLLFCGRRREMEDTATIVTPFVGLGCQIVESESAERVPSDLHFFGVYDGHGGSQASLYCMESFHHSLAEEIEKGFSAGYSNDMWNAKWDEVMKATFFKVDKDVGGICPNGIQDDDKNANSKDIDDYTLDNGCLCCVDAIAPDNVGTTAVVAVIGSSQIVIGNCGDSRAVLARGNTALPLSRDHKPEAENETNRIEAAGGRVICWDGYRVGGFLALSRAIGDRYLKRYVISEPEVTCIQRMPDDECLILGTDGLWDVVTNDCACEVARKSLTVLRKKYKSRPSLPGEDPAAAAVAALLVKLAYSRGSKDNISVVVVDLKARPCG